MPNTAMSHLDLGLRARVQQVADHGPEHAEGGWRVDDQRLVHQLGVVVLQEGGSSQGGCEMIEGIV